jgi:hypothetical protein
MKLLFKRQMKGLKGVHQDHQGHQEGKGNHQQET